jgi:1-acyl-sn-glycerol-3-phosphate acyltransferase
VVSFSAGAAASGVGRRRGNPLIVRCYRFVRTCVHVLAGVMTTLLVFPRVSDTRRRWLVRRWSGRLLRILKVDARLHGELSGVGGNYLVVANHISWLDIFALNAHHPVRFVAKSEIASWPVLSQMVRGAGTLFIDRHRPHDTHRVIQEIARVLGGGDVVAVFPEGTTTYGSDVLPFKSSLFQPIVAAHGHVQPVAIRYRTVEGDLAMAPTYVGDTTFFESFWAVCREPALTVDLVVRPALPAAQARHRRDLARAAEASIRTALSEPGRATEPDIRVGQPA